MLEANGFIKRVETEESSNSIVLREKAYQLIDPSTTKYFIELYNTFPYHVIGKGGKRMLRTVGTDTSLFKRLDKKYANIIKGKEKTHIYIMKCLDIELNERRTSNSMTFLQSLEVWLNQRGWEKYEHLLKSDTVTSREERYGEQLRS